MKVPNLNLVEGLQKSSLNKAKPLMQSSPRLRLLSFFVLLLLCSVFGYAIAQTFSTTGTLTIQGTSSTTVNLNLPVLPSGATSLTLQRATVSRTPALPPTTGRVLWLKADSVTGVSDGGSLSRWESVGSSYHATQSTSGARPSWIAQAINGRPAVRFDGADDYLSFPAGMRDFSQGLSAFVVTKPTSTPYYARFFEFANGPSSDNIFLSRIENSESLNYETYQGGGGSSTYVDDGILTNQVQVLSVVQQGGAPNTDSSSTLYRNGVSLATSLNAVPRILDRSNNYIGKSNWPDALFQGDIAEILLYKRALSSTERQDIDGYLNSKYGLSTAPGSLTWSTIATGLAGNATYQDTGLAPDTQYFYRCVAVNGTTNPTGPATSVTTLPLTPDAPPAPTYSSVNATYLTVQVPSLPARASNLVLQQKLATQPNTAYSTIAQSVSGSYLVAGLTAQTGYNFRFIAVGEGGNTTGIASSVTTIASDATSPAAPIVLGADSTSVELNLPVLPSGATSLTLQRATVSRTPALPPTTGRVLWLKADSVTGVSDGGSLSRWESVGSSYHATQSTSGARPSWIAQAINGRPAVRFDGADDYLSFPAGMRDFSQGLSAFVVTKPTSTPYYARFFEFANGPSSDNIFLSRIENSESLNYETYQGGGGSSTYVDDGILTNQVQVLSVVQQGGAPNTDSSSTLYRNGVSLATSLNAVPRILDRSNNYIGKSNWPDALFQGDIAEILLYKRALSSTERQDIDGYLNSKYGLSTAPGSLTWSTIATGLAGNATYQDTGLAPDTQYFYRCVAVNGTTNPTGPATSVTTLPLTPNAPTVVSATASSIKLALPVLPAGADSFQLEYKLHSEDAGGYTFVADNLAGGVESTVSGLTPSSSYDFRVVSIGDGGQTPGLPLTAFTISRGTGSGLTGWYYQNETLTSPAAHIRLDPTIDFHWNQNTPAPSMTSVNNYSARWRGEIEPLYTERYKFRITCDEGARLWIGGNLVIDVWTQQGEFSGEIDLEKGKKYDIRLEYRNGNFFLRPKANAHIVMEWESPSQRREIVPQQQLYPVPLTEENGLTAHYFDDENLTQFYMARIDNDLNFEWGYNAPAPQMGFDTFSVRWTGKIQPRYSEAYTFTLQADDGARLWVNNQLVTEVLSSTSATGSITLTANQKYDIKVEYKDQDEYARVRLLWQSASQPQEIVPPSRLFHVPSPSSTTGTGTGLRGRYYRNKTFGSSELILSRLDAQLNFNWRTAAPSTQLQAKNFCARWTGKIEPLYSETYRLSIDSQDQCRIWINGTLLIDRWSIDVLSNPQGPYGMPIEMVAGQKYDIKVEYIDTNNADLEARIRLLWTSTSQMLEAIPQSQLYPEQDSTQLGNGTGLRASYFQNQTRYYARILYHPGRPCDQSIIWEIEDMPNHFAKLVDSRQVPQIDLDWADYTPWGVAFGEDFSARFEGEIQPLYSETYTFKTETDEGVRLWINGQQLINNWTLGGVRNQEATITLQAGQKYALKMEMFDARRNQDGATNGSVARLRWSSPSQPLEIVPQRQLYPPVVKHIGSGTGLRGHYYSKANHIGLIDNRIDDDIDFDWSTNNPFSMDRNTFSVRWIGYIEAGYNDNYRLIANTDDVVRVWIGGQQIINNEKVTNAKFGMANLPRGVKVPIVVEFVQSNGEAHVSLEWESPHQTREIIPSSQLYPEADPQLWETYGSCVSANSCSPCPQPAPHPEGVIQLIDVPSQVVAGQSYPVKLLMRNTGNINWTAGFGSNPYPGAVNVNGLSAQGYLWGSFDERQCPLILQPETTVLVDSNTTALGVPPGEVGKFTGTLIAPSTPGIYHATWNLFGMAAGPTPHIQVRVVSPADTKVSAPRILQTTTNSVKLHLPDLPVNSDGLKLQRTKQVSPDAPSTTGLKLWLKADSLTAAKSGEVIPSWSDSSGQNSHATQANAAKRPIKLEEGINGRPTVRFDGKDDSLEFPVINDIRSVFIVLRDREAGKNNGSILGNHIGGGNENFVGGGTVNLFSWWNGLVREGSGAVNGYETPTLDIKRSGDFQVVSVQTFDNASAQILAHGFNNVLAPWDGDIAEILIYNTTLNAANKRSVEAYLTAKYGRPTSYEPVSGATWTTLSGTYNGGEEYTDSGLDENSTYWYRCVPVESGSTAGKSAHTTTLDELDVPVAPSAPTFSAVTANSVTVHAPALPTGAQYLTLQFKEQIAPDGAYVSIDQKIVPSSSIVVDDLEPLTQYSFRYVATNPAGQTNGVAATTTTTEQAPEAPEAPSIQSVEQTKATLKMPVLPARAETLQLQMKAWNSENYVTLVADIAPLTSYTANNLASGKSYLFRCIAVNDGGSTPGLVAGFDTDVPLPEAPSRPRFSALADTSVDVTAPALPTHAVSLSLQARAAFSPDSAYVTIAKGLSAYSLWRCTSLQSGTEYEFRYVAVNTSGSTPGISANVTTLIPQVTWSAGLGIDCLGIRFPEAGLQVAKGSVVKLDGYLATDFDLKQVLAGDASRVTKHSDTCSYAWTVSGGSFVDNTFVGQKVGWIAPTTPGTYTIGLTVDDQSDANKKTTEGGNRNDNISGFNDAPQKYQVTVTVLP